MRARKLASRGGALPLLLVAAIWPCSPVLASEPLGPPLNVLLIITDQQHAGMIGCAGNAWLETPAIDSLAERGVRFERAYCGNPVCVPSRFSMMAGVLPSRIGMDRNRPAGYPVPPEILQNTLGHVFRRAGYHTVYGGKVHLPGTAKEGIGAYGFELLTDDQREGLAAACGQFLAGPHDQPFLLVASFINPHDICYMAIDAYGQANDQPRLYPRSSAARECLAEALQLPTGISRDEFFAHHCPPLPENFEIPAGEPAGVRQTDWRGFRPFVQQHWSEQQWRLHRWAYARLTERVDRHIGQLLDALHKSGLEQNTLVVFTSDHGDLDGAHRLEHKSMPYEEAVRVPFVVSHPDIRLAGHVDRSHLVSTGLDLIPTLCDFAGIEMPATAGRSVKPLALDPQAVHAWRTELVIENERSRILVSSRYKYAVYESGEPREMLVDRTADPGEMHNLAVNAQHSPLLQEHRQLLRAWYAANGETWDPKFDAIGQRSHGQRTVP